MSNKFLNKKINIIFLIFVSIFSYGVIPAVYNIIGSSPERDRDLAKKAVQNKDYTLCRTISAGYIMSMNQPRMWCYYGVLKKIKDTKLCHEREIQKYIQEDDCYKMITTLQMAQKVLEESTNTEFCKEYEIQKYLSQEECYKMMATAHKDTKICTLINIDYLKQECLDEVNSKN